MSIIFDALRKVQREKSKQKADAKEPQPPATQAAGSGPQQTVGSSGLDAGSTLHSESTPKTVQSSFDDQSSPEKSSLPPLPEIIFDEQGPSAPEPQGKKKLGGKTPLLVGAAVLVVVVGGTLATRVFLGSKKPAAPTNVALAPQQGAVPLAQKVAAAPPQPALIPQPEPPAQSAPQAVQAPPAVTSAPETEVPAAQPPSAPPSAGLQAPAPAPAVEPASVSSAVPPEPARAEGEIPKLKINILRPASPIYPQARAVVNLQPVGEGDVVDGAKVIKINPGNIEFEFQGQRFTVKF